MGQGLRLPLRLGMRRLGGGLVHHFDALNAALVVVNPNVQSSSNGTSVQRRIVETWRVIKRIVRERHPVHQEGLFCGTYSWSRTEILDDPLHNQTLSRHIRRS